jgi:very-short-patch-repair endonuclease
MQASRLKRFQKSMRANQTYAEQKLWYHLRKRNLLNYKFRRQHIIQGYIVDFVCLQHKLIIELDGGQHLEQKRYDDIRTQKLQEHGFRVLRFWNNDVILNMDAVLDIFLSNLCH